MNIYWAGGEDVSFPNGAAVGIDTNTAHFRSAYARCALGGQSTLCKSTTFQLLTSAWFSFRGCWITIGAGEEYVGLGKSGTNCWFGLGMSSIGTNAYCLFKDDGTTRTELARSSDNQYSSAVRRFDIQVVNFGASATVNVYIDWALLITFSGNLTVTGMTTGFDSVYLHLGNKVHSEMCVADSDTRGLLGVQTLALTGAGDVNAWTNPTFSNINGVTLSDTNPTFTNTAGLDNEYNVTDPNPTTYVPVAVHIAARCAQGASSTSTQIKFGYKATGGAGPAFGTGSTKTPSLGAYGTIDQVDNTNPLTSSAWVQGDMNALQLAFESA